MNNFKERTVIEYGNEYDLTATIFKGNSIPLQINCPNHGLFKITPDNFLYRAGCPQCRGKHSRGYPARRGRGNEPKKKTGRKPFIEYFHFYIHNVDNKFLKFGITSGSVEGRRIGIESNSDFKHELIFRRTFNDRLLCAAIERSIKLSFETNVAPAGSMTDGITETVNMEHLDQIIKIVNSFPHSKNAIAPEVPLFIKV